MVRGVTLLLEYVHKKEHEAFNDFFENLIVWYITFSGCVILQTNTCVIVISISNKLLSVCWSILSKEK